MCTVWPWHSKRLSEYSSESASNFALSLNIPPWKLFGWFRRPQLWATGDGQLHHDNVPTHTSHLMQSFWWNIKSPRWLIPLQPRFRILRLLASPKTKITFEREEISDHRWYSGKYNRAANGNWENCARSQGAYFEGDWGSIVLCAMFLVSCIVFNKCLTFHMAWLDIFRKSLIWLIDGLVAWYNQVLCTQ